MGERATVAVAAGGEAWELEALRQVEAGRGLVLLKRCVDLADLLASAATGQMRVALVAAGLPGLDHESVEHLHRCGTSLVLVGESPLAAIVAAAVSVEDLQGLAIVLLTAATWQVPDEGAGEAVDLDVMPTGPASHLVGEHLSRETIGSHRREPGRVVAVWGPTGAPGRTTVALALGAQLAARGHETIVVDADAYGGTVAQHLGVLDEVSGLLAAARAANSARLDTLQLAACARGISPNLRVLTGLPRADRWPEVRESAFADILEVAAQLCDYVILDLGFSLETGDQVFGSTAPSRNHMTLTGLGRADDVIVVGAADPVGLARVARALVELPDVVPVAGVRVVVNRMRRTLGWSERDVAAMIEGFGTATSLRFLPQDNDACDRALLSGRALPELGDSPLNRAVAQLADDLVGSGSAASSLGARRRLRRRRAGTAR